MTVFLADCESLQEHKKGDLTSVTTDYRVSCFSYPYIDTQAKHAINRRAEGLYHRLLSNASSVIGLPKKYP